MFSALTEQLENDVNSVKRALMTHDAIRALIFPPEEGSEVAVERVKLHEGALAPLRAGAPTLLAWRIYDHSAAFTRLYAVYERFVEDLVARWIHELPLLYDKYEALPEPIRRGHRLGVAYVLNRLGGDRYGHLPETTIARGFFEGVSGAQPYRLLPEVFLIDEQNLRPEVLNALCVRIGLEGAWDWIIRDPDIRQFIREIRGNASTAESELRNFIHYRNVAAHGAIEEIVASDEIRTIADFIVLLGRAIAELMALRSVSRRLDTGKAVRIGRVFRTFRDRIVAIRMRAVPLTVGDEVMILRGQSCRKASVESIQINHESFDNVEGVDGVEVGVRLTRAAPERSSLVRLVGETPG
jgi:hypothetical protein